jgi:hypothetical protein
VKNRTVTHIKRISLKRSILIALGCFTAIVLLTLQSVFEMPVSIAQAPPPVRTVPLQPSPSAPPTATPTPKTTEGVPIDPVPGSRTDPPKPPTATPSASPTAVPTPAPPPPLPSVIIPTDAQPLPIAGDHKDPLGRFQIGLLKGYRVMPLGDSILVEAPDGRLAYTVLAQSAAQLGFLTGVALTPENLAQVVRNTLGRGEGFQAELPQSIDNGIQMNWTGTLTIGGKPQPVKGVVIAKPAPVSNSIVMLTIAVTDQGAPELQGAIGALATSLQPI